MLEKGKTYTNSDLEKLGLIKYKELISGTVIFKNEIETFWFQSKTDFLKMITEYMYLAKT